MYWNITVCVINIIGLVLMFGMIFCSLDEQKGIALGATYRNKTQAKEFTQYIAEAERDEIREMLKKTRFLSHVRRVH